MTVVKDFFVSLRMNTTAFLYRASEEKKGGPGYGLVIASPSLLQGNQRKVQCWVLHLSAKTIK